MKGRHIVQRGREERKIDERERERKNETRL